MKDIASHILDITENSVRAGSSLIKITITVSQSGDLYKFEIEDNGCGMKPEQVEQLQNPFFTSRTNRRVGLGVPLLMQNCQMSGGDVFIESNFGSGTKLIATFQLSHIDRPPEGEIADVMVNIITGYSEVDFEIKYSAQNGDFELNTTELKEIFDGIPINDVEVISAIKELVSNNLGELINK